MVEVESRIEKAAGATTPTRAEVKGAIIEHLWQLKKNGYSTVTVQVRINILKRLVRAGVNIFDPEEVKDYLAKRKIQQSSKASIVNTYTTFLKMRGKTWTRPRYRQARKIPFIPTEAEIDQLIAGCGKKTATFLQLLKETAMRSGEASVLKWTDINAINKTIILNNPEKNSNPRIFKVSDKLIGMVNTLRKSSEWIFGKSHVNSRATTFRQQRNRLAIKLQNPRIRRITFHTLRHWKATMLYHKTKDIIYVKNFLGHKEIKNTMLYIQVAETIHKDIADRYVCKVATTIKEAEALIELGFEYVTEMDGVKLFRKVKC